MYSFKVNTKINSPSKVLKDWLCTEYQSVFTSSVCHFYFSHRSLFYVTSAVISDNKYLEMQVYLLLISFPSFSPPCALISVCPLSKLFIFQNETPHFVLITVVFSFNYKATADEVLPRFTYGLLRRS